MMRLPYRRLVLAVRRIIGLELSAAKPGTASNVGSGTSAGVPPEPPFSVDLSLLEGRVTHALSERRFLDDARAADASAPVSSVRR